MPAALQDPALIQAMAARMRAARDARGVRVRDIMRAVGVGRTTVERWFRGDRPVPVTVLPIVARVLGTDPNTLLGVAPAGVPPVTAPDPDPVVSAESGPCPTEGSHRAFLLVRRSGRAEVVCPVCGRRVIP